MIRTHIFPTAILFLLVLTTQSQAAFGDPKESIKPADRVYQTSDGHYKYDWPKLSDEYVQTASLDEISKWLQKQSRDSSTAIHYARKPKHENPINQEPQVFTCDVIVIFSRPDMLTPEQWKILAHRVHDAILSTDPKTNSVAYSMLFQIQQSVHDQPGDELMQIIMGNDQLRKLLDQLEEQDSAARITTLSTISTLSNSGPPPSQEAYRTLLRHLEQSPYVKQVIQGRVPTREESQEVSLITNILSSWRVFNSSLGAFDEEFAQRVIEIADSLPSDDRQASMIRILLGHTHGAPKTVMEYVSTLSARKGAEPMRVALLILQRQVSFYDNKDPASRAIAMSFAIPILRDLSKITETDELSQSVLMTVASSAMHLGPDAAQLLDMYIKLLEYPDGPNHDVRSMAITSLGDIGAAAHPALPRLRELADEKDNLESSIREAIYMIEQVGEKPSGYDRAMSQRAQALEDAGYILVEPADIEP